MLQQFQRGEDPNTTQTNTQVQYMVTERGGCGEYKYDINFCKQYLKDII